MKILYHFINKFHHKTTRFSCGGVGYFRARPQDFLVVWQDIGIRTFYCITHSHPLHKIFLRSCGELFTTRPRENLVVGVGFGVFSFSPKDHKFHHKIFKCYKKMQILYHFINKIHHETTRKSCGKGGLGTISFFTTRPKDSPHDF